MLRVTHNSIAEFSQFLKMVCLQMDRTEGFPVQLFQQSPRFVLVRDWFVGSSGVYSDPGQQIRFYQEQAKQFVTRYLEVEKQPTEIQQRTLVVVGPLVTHVREITDQLIAVIGVVKKESSINHRRL